MTAGWEKIQRWECRLADPEECGDGWCDDMAEMSESETGDYVLYSDARAWVIAELEALAKASCEYCRQGYSHFSNKHGCETIRRRIAELEKDGKS